ncbi:MAG: succinate dehydrogenase assembly factor 4 [Steroidobacteraceae bacterium]
MGREATVRARFWHNRAMSPEDTATPAVQPSQGVDELAAPHLPDEQGGPTGPEPTRFGDWERKGRCIDF